MFTVHTKNKSPETGFDPQPASRHKTEETAVQAAMDLAIDSKTYGRTVMVFEEGTNLAISVEYRTGEPTIGYDEGEPYLIPSPDSHFRVTRDDREEIVERREETDDYGVTVVHFDQPEDRAMEGDIKVTVYEIKKDEVSS